MSTERICFIVVTVLWTVRWYFAQREISRLRDRAWVYNERAYILHDFIKTHVPDVLKQAEQVLADKTKWRTREHSEKETP